jgi:hypothetical protein
MTSLPDDTTAPDFDAEDWATIQSAFDPALWSRLGTIPDVQRAYLIKLYRVRWTSHCSRGATEEEAERRALQDITNVWGISAVCDTGDECTLRPFPPEKVYEGKTINGSFDWVLEQAADVLCRHLVERGHMVQPPPNWKPREHLMFTLVPKPGSLRRFREGLDVSYDIFYHRHDKGILKAVGVTFTPSFEVALAQAFVSALVQAYDAALAQVEARSSVIH